MKPGGEGSVCQQHMYGPAWSCMYVTSMKLYGGRICMNLCGP
jgi:hypothetical protein